MMEMGTPLHCGASASALSKKIACAEGALLRQCSLGPRLVGSPSEGWRGIRGQGTWPRVTRLSACCGRVPVVISSEESRC
jgi:hypothetical protein